MCSAAEQCQIYDLIELEADYNVADGCDYERLNITFGCYMYDSLIKLTRYRDSYSSRDDETSSTEGVTICVIILIIIIGFLFLLGSYCKEYCQANFADDTDPWPSSATGGTYPQPATGRTDPPPATSRAYPQPATGGTYPQPATGGTYPQPATSRTDPPPATSRAYPQPATGGTYLQPATGRTDPPPATGRTYP